MIKALCCMLLISKNFQDVIEINFNINFDPITNYSPSLAICALYFLETDCKPEEFNNTYIVTNDTRCNGVTIYACASGYNLTSGNLTRVCNIGPQWIGDPPVCSGKAFI